jgi:hypothetical protein
VYEAQGGASGEQLGMIAYLAEQIGFTNDGLAEWMGKRFGVRAIAEIASGDLAHRIIGGMKRMLANCQRA